MILRKADKQNGSEFGTNNSWIKLSGGGYMNRFFYSYLLLLFASFLLTGHTALQELLDFIWFFATSMYVLHAKKDNRVSFFSFIAALFMIQLPSFFASIASICTYYKKASIDWADGLLEIWIHPFLPILEFLPPVYRGELSDVFVKACFLPFTMFTIFILVWCLPAFSKIIRPEKP
jgi:hypothetical protein